MGNVCVLDSNVWALGFTENSAICADLVNEVRNGRLIAGINAYIYLEIDRIFNDITDPNNRSLTKQNFANFVYGCDNVSITNSDDVDSTTVSEVRSQSELRLISRLSGCESDDAPILILAWEIATQTGSGVPIHTTDKDFADSITDCSKLSMIRSEYVEL